MHFGLCIYAYCALMALVQSAFSLQRSLIQLSPELLLLSCCCSTIEVKASTSILTSAGLLEVLFSTVSSEMKETGTSLLKTSHSRTSIQRGRTLF